MAQSSKSGGGGAGGGGGGGAGGNRVKCVMLGAASVGKTSMVDKLLHNKFSGGKAPTVGAAFGLYECTLDKNKRVSLGIWDTAGSERFESMTKSYYNNAAAAVICYDLSDARSWEKAKFWVKEVLEVEEACIIALVGTKLDLINNGANRGVQPGVVKKYAASINAKTFETSAKDDSAGGDKISEPFEFIAREWMKQSGGGGKLGAAGGGAGGGDKNMIREYNPGIRLDEPPADNGSSKGCCK